MFKLGERIDQIGEENRQNSIASSQANKELGERIDQLGVRIDQTSQEVAKTNKAVTQTNIAINGIANSNGMFAEETIYNALAKKMSFGGIKFYRIDRNVKIHIKLLDMKGEYDVVLENGNTLAIIETKYKVRREDVSKLIEQPDNFRKLFPMYSNYKIVLGIGGMCFDNNVIEDAQQQGIGIIKVDNDTIEYYTDNLKKY
jgi:hypothetical protein